MSLPSLVRRAAVVLAAMTFVHAACAPAAGAFNPLKPVCKVAGAVSGAAGKVCDVAQDPGRAVKAGKSFLSGHPVQAAKTALGDTTSAVASKASVAVAIAGLVTAMTGSATFALHETAKVMGETTSPQLRSSWFSSTYWRIGGLAAVLTLPFLFAAAVQALMRSDLALLTRSAFGYLPLAMLAVGVATPITMLLLSASDQLSALVSGAAGDASGHLLKASGLFVAGLAALSGSPFLGFFIGFFVVIGALALWIELLIREAAVYVIVLMLPLAFAAFVWPARRVWAVRAIELLVALIISKFAIVAVLSLGGAALGGAIDQHSIAALLAGLVLLMMGAFAPWAMLRLLPLAELASGATGSLVGELHSLGRVHERVRGVAQEGENWATSATAEMRRDAETAAATTSEGGPQPGLPSVASQNGAAHESASSAALSDTQQAETSLAEMPVAPPAVAQNETGEGAHGSVGASADESARSTSGAAASAAPGDGSSSGKRATDPAAGHVDPADPAVLLPEGDPLRHDPDQPLPTVTLGEDAEWLDKPAPQFGPGEHERPDASPLPTPEPPPAPEPREPQRDRA